MAEQHPEVIARNRFVGNQSEHTPELFDRRSGIPLELVGDAQIEPRVGQRRIPFLHRLELSYSLIGFACFEQGESVVQPFADRIGIQIERFAKLDHGLLLCGGVFVKRFPQIAVLPYQVVMRRPMRALEDNRRHYRQTQGHQLFCTGHGYRSSA